MTTQLTAEAKRRSVAGRAPWTRPGNASSPDRVGCHPEKHPIVDWLAVVPMGLTALMTEPTSTGADEKGEQVLVHLPAVLAAELAATADWLADQLDHRLPGPLLRGALVLGGLAHPDRVLAALREAAALETATSSE